MCRIPIVALCMFATMTPLNAFAGCEKDTDCKGERVCVSGLCIYPDRVPLTPATLDVAKPTGFRHGPIILAGFHTYGWTGGMTGTYGLMYAFEYRPVYFTLEALTNPNRPPEGLFGGLGIGMGWLFPVRGSIVLGLTGAFGIWGSQRSDWTYGGLTYDGQCCVKVTTFDKVKIYGMLSSFIRFGSSWTFSLGPRLGVGERYRSDVDTNTSSGTLGVLIQTGYLFGGK